MQRRVRWGNVARAAGAMAVVAVVVAWPRLAPPQPAVPESGPAPLGGAAAPAPLWPAEKLGEGRRPAGRRRETRGPRRGASGGPRRRAVGEPRRRAQPGRRAGGPRGRDRGTEPLPSKAHAGDPAAPQVHAGDPVAPQVHAGAPAAPQVPATPHAGAPEPPTERPDGERGERRPRVVDPAQVEFGFESG